MDYEKFIYNHTLKNSFFEATQITDKWGYIRQAYMDRISDIKYIGNKNVNYGIAPYFFDWSNIFSPIEEHAWTIIRTYGIVLYPQFPVLNYFIDFANPVLKIGVELDGKDYHDEKKDAVRDQKLYEFGWRIFRIKGSECYAKITNPKYDEDQSLDKYKDWLYNTCEGVLYSIFQYYYINMRDCEDYSSYVEMTLRKHNLVGFPLIK